MPTLLYKGQGLVKGVGFDSWRPIGPPMQALKVFNLRQVDELVFLDITATTEGHSIDFNLIDDLADECFMPFTVGGGVRSVEDMRDLLRVGADRVSVCSMAVENPELVREMSNRFGSQSVVVSIDVIRQVDGSLEVCTHSGTRPRGIDPVQFARTMEEKGAGEILLTSVDRDGTMEGYDINLIRSITSAVSLPVIASGGAGSYADMLEALKAGGASAVAAASIFQFTEQTPLEAKRFLYDNGIPIRL